VKTWRDVASTAIDYAFAWCGINQVDIPFSVLAGLAAVKFTIGQDLADIQDEYNTRLYSAMDDYTATERPITAFRNAFKRVVYEGFFAAGQAGWIDAGATGPIPDSLTEYINGRFERETEFIDDLFVQLKELRKMGTADEIANHIKARADGYTGTLEGVYNYAKMAAQATQIGVWRFGDTIHHCETTGDTIGCSELEGQEHELSWFLERNYVPRQRGSTTLTCGGWECDCRVIDTKTGEQLI